MELRSKSILLFAFTVVGMISSCTLKRQTVMIYNTGAKFKTLNEAVKMATDGDSIIVYPGKYVNSDEIWLDKNNVKIVGVGKPQILCDDMTKNVIWIISDNVIIKNLKLSHIKPSFYANCVGNVIALDNANQVTIEDCDINGCGRIGVYMFSAHNIILKNNWIHENSLTAVQIDDVNIFSETDQFPGIIHFENNRIENNGDGTEIRD